MILAHYMHQIGACPADPMYDVAYDDACAMLEDGCTDEEVQAYLRECFGPALKNTPQEF